MSSRLALHNFSPRIRRALVVGFLGAAIFTLASRSPQGAWYFQVTIRSSLSGTAHLYHDLARSGDKEAAVQVAIRGDNSEDRYQFPLPEGIYSKLRFEPVDQPSAVLTLSKACIVDRSGRLIREVAPNEIKALKQVEGFDVNGTEIRVSGASLGGPMVLEVAFVPPLILKSFATASARTMLRRFVVSFLFLSIAALFIPPVFISKTKDATRRWRAATAVWVRAHPLKAVLIIAAAAVVASCYPIVFFGKSFLSPNNHSHTYLLYEDMPTVPGYTEKAYDDARGSDMGSALWYSWPVSVVERRALLRYFELPLWNRYNSMGLPLLGQGQSMFGDPLHLIALLTNGSPGLWDLKYLLAKLLFGFSLGFCVLRLTKHIPSAAVTAATAPFIGFFSYRYSHPAFFSLCYAPLILLCWLNLIDTPKRRSALIWTGAMVLANWLVLTSGTVKEAYILLLAINACGLLSLFLTIGVPDRFWKLRQVVYVQVLFLLISAPIWLTFLRTLQASSTFYDKTEAYQLQPGVLVGLFDDIFYRQLNVDELHLDPSLNFLVLAAVLWFWLSHRERDPGARFSGLSITALVAVAGVFGLIPRALIIRLPFLARIHHIDNTFSCVAIVCLLVLAGCGITAFWRDCRTSRFREIYPRFLFCLLLLVALYLGTTGVVQRSTFLRIAEQVPKSAFFWGYSLTLVSAAAILPPVARLAILRREVFSVQTLSVGLVVFLLQWRHGMHLSTQFDAYVMNPQQRADLMAQASEALNLIKDRSSEPGRTAGLRRNFSPGYGQAVDIEQIDSADPLLNPFYRTLIDTFGIRLPFASSHDGVLGEDLTPHLRLLDMLNVRFYLGFTDKPALAPSVNRIAAVDLKVFESTTVWPRAFFTDRLTVYRSESDFVALLRKGDGRPFAGLPEKELETHAELRPILDKSPPTPERKIVGATNYRLTNNTTSFNIAATGPGTLVLTEPYVKDDFRLTINGKPADYFRVNSAFRGVTLPGAGDYDVVFSYWPRYLTPAFALSAVGLAWLVFWLVIAWKRTHPET